MIQIPTNHTKHRHKRNNEQIGLYPEHTNQPNEPTNRIAYKILIYIDTIIYDLRYRLYQLIHNTIERLNAVIRQNKAFYIYIVDTFTTANDTNEC